ncbi:hypothetical protein [Luteipulveratus halotolerans]|uniref:hypothetical protein n=1 Tax=Luteipulveratus halotolerans TaxID=1631356 RepID=UPI000682D443|nr:hypothetical protein [Luteipulveratus halotolerans]
MSAVTDDIRAEVEWERWHVQREADLATDYGWLSLTGFSWLADSPSTVGGLPGQWWATDTGAHLRAEPAGGRRRTGRR